MVNWRAGDVSPLFRRFQAESAKWLWKRDWGLKTRNSGLTPTAVTRLPPLAFIPCFAGQGRFKASSGLPDPPVRSRYK